MPANTAQAAGFGPEIHTGQNYSIITASETNQLKTRPGKVGQLLVSLVGTAWTIDIYDHGSTNTNRIFQWVTASGVGVFAIQCPMSLGIRVVSTGTAGEVTLVWS